MFNMLYCFLTAGAMNMDETWNERECDTVHTFISILAILV
jgi:hypothetical protein